MPLRALIVDDEPVARRVLREELESIGGVEVVGEAENGAAALSEIAARRPDLVLLDLQMPIMGGLEMIRRIERAIHMPVIVVVTAFDDYALQAFEAGAVDYLLKPVGQKRLTEAVERARRVSDREAAEKLARLQEVAGEVAGEIAGEVAGEVARGVAGDARKAIEPGSGDGARKAAPRKIVGKLGEEYFLLNSEEILAFQAEGDIVWIISGRGKFFATQTLKDLERRLGGATFRRIHRNALVNVDHVRKLSALSSQRWLITLTNNQEFIASKRQARNVRQILKW